MKRLPASLAVAVFLLGAALRLINAGTVTVRSPDEWVYTAQAKALLDHKIEGIRAISDRYLHVDAERMFPPPTRVGFTGMIAGVMSLAGRQDPGVGALLSCAASIFALALTIRLGWRFIDPWAGVLAGLFLAVFRPDLVIARRTWTDAVLCCLGLGLVYCAMAIGAGARRGAILTLAALGSFALLVKEAAVSFYGLCLLWALWSLVRRREWREAGLLVGASAGGAIAVLGVMSWAVGGFANVVNVALGIGPANAANLYALQFQTGPGYQLLQGFWIMGPLLITLALAGMAVVLGRRAAGFHEPASILGLAMFTLVLLAIPMILPHWLNLRYVSVIFAPLCLFAATSVVQVLRLARRLPGRYDFTAALVVAAIILAQSSFSEYRTFERSWVQQDPGDLSIRLILESAK